MKQRFLTQTKNNLPALIPLFASFLFIFQRALLSATTAPAYKDSPKRYFLYLFMKALVLAGVNLLPLWLGYHYKKFRKINPLSKLAKSWMFYVLTLLAIFVFFFVLRNTLSIRDLWVILFPISQNVYQLGIGFMIAFLLAPWLTAKLDELTDKQILRLSGFFTVMLVVLPTIFSKDIWNVNEGKSFLWQLYLVVIGYVLFRFDFGNKKLHIILHVFLSMFIVCGLIYLMKQISVTLGNDGGTINRFSIPNSLFVTYYSVALFLFLEKIQKQVHLTLTPSFLASFLIVTQIITNNGLTTWSVYAYYRRPMVASLLHWGGWIIIFFFVYLAAALILATLFYLLSKSKLFGRIENKLSISSIPEFFEKVGEFRAWLKQRKRLWLVTGLFYLLVIVQMFAVILVTTASPGKTFFKNMLQCQPQIILNVMIMMAIFFFIFLLTNRYWYAMTFTIVLSVVLTISSYLKISLRQEPVLPADMVMLANAGEIISMIQPTLLIIGGVIIVILAISAFIMQRRASQRYHLKMGYKKRFLGIAVLLALFSGVFFINHQNTPPNLLFRLFKVNNRFFNQPGGAQTNGPLVQFLVNVDVEVMSKPANYSEEKISEIMKKYDATAETINQQREDWSEDQVLIFNLSESFSDPTRMPETKVNSDPIPTIHQVLQKNTSGLMLSSGYGGGTANMEWETLSGLSLSNLSPTLTTPYSQLVEKMTIAPNITDLFDHKVAIHPYTAKLYNRIRVFDKYGFDAFYHVGSKNELTYTDKISGSDYISDASAFKETLRLINEEKKGTQFIQLSSMQNHSPYTHDYPDDDFSSSGTSVLDNNRPLLNNYLQGIHYTDEAMADFLAELDKIQKPITYVFYGDHLPGFYNGLDKSRYGLNMRETDYFVYNNAYSRKQSKIKQDVISPNLFSALAFEQANLKVTPYYALLTNVLKNVPPTTTDPESSVNNKYNGGQVFLTPDGQMIEESALTKEQKEIFEDYRLIQYDLAVGKQYSGKWAKQKIE